MKANAVFVECVEKSWDVEPFAKSAFAQDEKGKGRTFKLSGLKRV